MKKPLLLLCAILMTFIGFSQRVLLPVRGTGFIYNSIRVDSALTIMGDTTVEAPVRSLAIQGDALFQKFSSDGHWHQVLGIANIDTTNRWVNSVGKNTGGDSLVFYIGQQRIAVKDSVGSGGGSPNSSLGSAFKIAVPGTNNIKSIRGIQYVLFDTLTSGEIRARVDTAGLALDWLSNHDYLLQVNKKYFDTAGGKLNLNIDSLPSGGVVLDDSLTVDETTKPPTSDAAARAINNRNEQQNIINVLLHHVVADGVTNTAPAIQALIASNTHLHFPYAAQPYYLTDSLDISNVHNFTLTCDPGVMFLSTQSTIFHLGGNLNAIDLDGNNRTGILYSNKVSNVYHDGLTVLAIPTNNLADSSNRMRYINVHGWYMSNPNDYANAIDIYSEGRRSMVEDSHFDNNWIDSCSRFPIEAKNHYDTTQRIRLQNLTFNHNKITEWGRNQTGIAVAGISNSGWQNNIEVGWNTFKNAAMNTTSHVYYAYENAGGHNVDFHNNTAEVDSGHAGYTFILGSGPDSAKTATWGNPRKDTWYITNNTVKLINTSTVDKTRVAFADIQNADNVVMTGNVATVEGPGVILSNTKNARLNGNTIISKSDYATWLRFKTVGTSLSGNTFQTFKTGADSLNVVAFDGPGIDSTAPSLNTLRTKSGSPGEYVLSAGTPERNRYFYDQPEAMFIHSPKQDNAFKIGNAGGLELRFGGQYGNEIGAYNSVTGALVNFNLTSNLLYANKDFAVQRDAHIYNDFYLHNTHPGTTSDSLLVKRGDNTIATLPTSAIGGGAASRLGTATTLNTVQVKDTASGSIFNIDSANTSRAGNFTASDFVELKSKPKVFNIETYGAVGDSATNNTVAMQNCMNALVASGGGVYYVPNGMFLTDSLRIPAFNAASTVPIRIVGESVNHFFGTIGSANMPNKGAIIKSTNTTSGNSVIRVDPSTGPNFSTVSVAIRDLEVRTYNNPSIGGIDLKWAAFVPLIDNVFINTGVYNVNASEPTHGTAGLVTPAQDNGAMTNLSNMTITGYADGIINNEHTYGSDITVASNIRGVNFQTGDHASYYTRLGMYRNTYNIYMTGSTVFGIGQMNVEHEDSSIMDANNMWQVRIADVYDPSNLGQADINWNCIKGFLGRDHLFVKNGGANIQVREIGSAPAGGIGGSGATGQLSVWSSGSAIAATGFNTTGPSAKIGAAVFQSINADNFILGNNTYFNGTDYQAVTTGPSESINAFGGTIIFNTNRKATAGTNLSSGGLIGTSLKLDTTGTVEIGNFPGTPDKIMVVSPTALTISAAVTPPGTITDSVFVGTTIGGITTVKKVAQSSLAGGSITAGYVGYGSGSNAVTGTANFSFDNSNSALFLHGSTTGSLSGLFNYDGPDHANAAYLATGIATSGSFFGTSGSTIISSSANGTGTQLPLDIGGYNGSWQSWLKLSTAGHARFSKYGSGSITGTAAYGAAFDASGNLIEVPNSGGGGGGTPTYSLVGATGAGTGASASISGKDEFFTITVTTGSSPSASQPVVTINLSAAYATASIPVFSPANGNAAALGSASGIYISQNPAYVALYSGTTPLAASTTYTWFVHVNGY